VVPGAAAERLDGYDISPLRQRVRVERDWRLGHVSQHHVKGAVIALNASAPILGVGL
jgi:hypothetical protein